MEKLIKHVQDYSINVGLSKGNTHEQVLKLVEELGHIASAVAFQDLDDLKVSIGNVMITLIIVCQQNNIEFPIDDHWLDFILGQQNDIVLPIDNKLLDSMPYNIYDIQSIAQQHNLPLEDCFKSAYDQTVNKVKLYAVHTQAEYDSLMKKLNKEGCKWHSGEQLGSFNPIIHDPFVSDFSDLVVRTEHEFVSYDKRSIFQERHPHVPIIEYSAYMKKSIRSVLV